MSAKTDMHQSDEIQWQRTGTRSAEWKKGMKTVVSLWLNLTRLYPDTTKSEMSQNTYFCVCCFQHLSCKERKLPMECWLLTKCHSIPSYEDIWKKNEQPQYDFLSIRIATDWKHLFYLSFAQNWKWGCLTRQCIVYWCGNVNILQVFQSLSVEEAQSGARAEGDPDTHPSHHHVGHHHAFFLMGLQLPLQRKDRTEWQVSPTQHQLVPYSQAKDVYLWF